MNNKSIRYATLALLLANFMGGLDSTVINTALPTIMNAMNGTRYLSLLTSIFLFFVAISTILWGDFAERIGNKKGFQLATLIFVGSSFIGALAPNIGILLLARALMGLGTGGMVSIPFIIYADLYPNNVERARALAWVTASYGLSVILGPVLGGLIVDTIGWRWTFGINVPIGLVSIIALQHFYIENERLQTKNNVDTIGITTLIGLLASVLYLFQAGTTTESWLNIALVIVIVILSLIFWRTEQHSENPLVPITLLTNWSYMGKNIIMVLFYGIFTAYSIYGPMWAQSLLGTSATVGGGTLMLSSVALIFATQLVARLMNHYEFKKIVHWAVLSLLIAGVILILQPVSAPYYMLVLAGIFIGLGQGLGMSPLQVAVQNSVPKEQLNIATTFSLLVRTLGQTLFASLYGAIWVEKIKVGIVAHPNISMDLMNKLGTTEVNNLSNKILNTMRDIGFTGIHLIFVIATIGVIIAVILNQTTWQNHK